MTELELKLLDSLLDVVGLHMQLLALKPATAEQIQTALLMITRMRRQLTGEPEDRLEPATSTIH